MTDPSDPPPAPPRSVVDQHNRDAGVIARSIVIPTLQAGGDNISVLILLESVVSGVLSVIAKPDGRDEVVDRLAANVKERLKNLDNGD